MKMVIKVENLCKQFRVRKNFPGISGAIKGLFCTSSTYIEAISHLSFSIKQGERVAFIGPNGAGKSTTIKMLTGILHPASGLIEVFDLVPWHDRKKLGFKIGTVFGQRSQLWYHLPPGRYV